MYQRNTEEFYTPYFELANETAINDLDFFARKITELEILRSDDSAEARKYIINLFHDMLSVFTQPFHKKSFDFSNEAFWGRIATMSDRLANDEYLRKLNGNKALVISCI